MDESLSFTGAKLRFPFAGESPPLATGGRALRPPSSAQPKPTSPLVQTNWNIGDMERKASCYSRYTLRSSIICMNGQAITAPWPLKASFAPISPAFLHQVGMVITETASTLPVNGRSIEQLGSGQAVQEYGSRARLYVHLQKHECFK